MGEMYTAAVTKTAKATKNTNAPNPMRRSASAKGNQQLSLCGLTKSTSKRKLRLVNTVVGVALVDIGGVVGRVGLAAIDRRVSQAHETHACDKDRGGHLGPSVLKELARVGGKGIGTVHCNY